MYFDPEKVEDVGGFDPIPAGWYKTMVTGVEVKPTRSGTGTYCGVKLQVVEGPHTKRLLFCNFNVQHENAEAQRIGRGQFKRFLKAVGITTGFEMAEVHSKVVNKTLFVKVEIGKHFQSGEPNNEVKDWNSEPKAAPHTSTQTKVKPKSDDLDSVPF